MGIGLKQMKIEGKLFFAMLAGLLALSLPTLAHHGYAAYDMTTVQTLKGTVTSFMLQNPHSTVSVDVADASGTVEHWFIEWGTVRYMKADGISSDSLKPGDVVTINFHPGKSGMHGGVMVNVVMSDGRMFPAHARSGGDTSQ
jgi:hypothetical protein